MRKKRKKGITKTKEELALLDLLKTVKAEKGGAEEEENKTRAIIANLPVGLLMFDPDQMLFIINPKAEYFLGIKAKDVISRSTEELKKIPILKLLLTLVEEDENGILKKQLKTKQNLTLEIKVVSVKREKRELGTLIILHDITREKAIEKMKTEFVSLSAHQLRTPLSAIKWTLKMLLDGDLGRLTEEQREFIEKTYKKNERMIGLISDLLNVTRIEEGRHLYKTTPVQIEDIVQFVINSFETEIRRKKIELKFKKPEKKTPKIKLDIEKIKLAIQNLLDNAVRYTPKSGKVTISLNYDKNKIGFSVKDTGIGIPESQQKKLFAKFFRGANAVKAETEGSGLGLYIAKNIVEAHGGRIWLESKENKGTSIHFSLPIKE